jgi:hypothetical protein
VVKIDFERIKGKIAQLLIQQQGNIYRGRIENKIT